ncbi:MAG: rod shape-determining protein MreC [Candidatus Omnitrophota bacterium]|nr:rod shape-determining protein MreC [Candidatus Omnitrophota bacterium]
MRKGNFFASKLNKRSQGTRNFWKLLEEKNSLLKETAYLREEVAGLKEASIENERLRNLLLFKKKSPGKMILARVIAKDSTNWHKTVVIDKGTDQGIKKDMPVVTPGGLVGKVIQTNNEVGQVMLIIDPNLKVSGLIQRTREEGIIEGVPSGLCKMRYLSLDTDLKVKDVVISSGLGGVYPKGLVIGRVKSAGKDISGLYSYALVEPMVDFSRLEEVLCLELKKSPLF